MLSEFQEQVKTKPRVRELSSSKRAIYNKLPKIPALETCWRPYISNETDFKAVTRRNPVVTLVGRYGFTIELQIDKDAEFYNVPTIMHNFWVMQEYNYLAKQHDQKAFHKRCFEKLSVDSRSLSLRFVSISEVEQKYIYCLNKRDVVSIDEIDQSKQILVLKHKTEKVTIGRYLKLFSSHLSSDSVKVLNANFADIVELQEAVYYFALPEKPQKFIELRKDVLSYETIRDYDVRVGFRGTRFDRGPLLQD